MSTRAVISVTLDGRTSHLYKHHDGDPAAVEQLFTVAAERWSRRPRSLKRAIAGLRAAIEELFSELVEAEEIEASRFSGEAMLQDCSGPDEFVDIEFRYELDWDEDEDAAWPAVRTWSRAGGMLSAASSRQASLAGEEVPLESFVLTYEGALDEFGPALRRPPPPPPAPEFLIHTGGSRKIEESYVEQRIDRLSKARRRLKAVSGGRIELAQLQLAACLGDPGARLALGPEAPTLFDQRGVLEGHVMSRRLGFYGREWPVRAGLAVGRWILTDVVRKDSPGRRELKRVVKAVRAWLSELGERAPDDAPESVMEVAEPLMELGPFKLTRGLTGGAAVQRGIRQLFRFIALSTRIDGEENSLAASAIDEGVRLIQTQRDGKTPPYSGPKLEYGRRLLLAIVGRALAPRALRSATSITPTGTQAPPRELGRAYPERLSRDDAVIQGGALRTDPTFLLALGLRERGHFELATRLGHRPSARALGGRCRPHEVGELFDALGVAPREAGLRALTAVSRRAIDELGRTSLVTLDELLLEAFEVAEEAVCGRAAPAEAKAAAAGLPWFYADAGDALVKSFQNALQTVLLSERRVALPLAGMVLASAREIISEEAILESLRTELLPWLVGLDDPLVRRVDARRTQSGRRKRPSARHREAREELAEAIPTAAPAPMVAPSSPKPSAPKPKPSAPKSKPSAPKSRPSAPKSRPSAPKSKPSAPKSRPSTPQSKPSAPHSKPSAPQSKPGAPKSRTSSESSSKSDRARTRNSKSGTGAEVSKSKKRRKRRES